MTSSRVEVRCPVRSKLFLVMQLTDEPITVGEGNLMEIACPDCRKHIGWAEGRSVRQVFHCYNILGKFIETRVVYSEE